MNKTYKSSMIINEKKILELKNQGYKAMDPHCHSSYSYDVPNSIETSPKNIVKLQQKKGLIPIITDHDTLDGYLEAKRHNNKIVSGVEIRIKPLKAKLLDYKNLHTLHINVYGLNINQYHVLNEIANKYRDLDMFVKFLREEDLEWCYNHPFWHERNEKIVWKAIPGLAKNYFDVIELNSSLPKSVNDLTFYIAEKLNKGIVSASDSHTGNPGRGFVVAEGKNFREFWNNIKEKKSFLYRSDMNTSTAVKEASFMIKNIFNSNKNNSFKSSLGLGVLDKVATSIHSGSIKNKFIIKKALYTIAQTINYSLGPFIVWRFYLKEKDAFIKKINTTMIKHVDNMSLNFNNFSKKFKTRYNKMNYNIKNKINNNVVVNSKIIKNNTAKKY